MAKKLPVRTRAANKQTAENLLPRQSGTWLANYRDTISCNLASQHKSSKGSWGGARNRADRTSDGLTDKQVVQLVRAAKQAVTTGRVFQRHWTVHYGKAGIQPHDGARFVGKLLDLVSKQAKRDGGQLTAIWVRECASSKGEHVHILMHLPTEMSLRNRTRRWIEAAGGTYRPGVSKVTIIGGTLSKIEADIDQRRCANAENVVRYVLKAASEAEGARVGLQRLQDGGCIVGKRCGWTQNIGHQARSVNNIQETVRLPSA